MNCCRRSVTLDKRNGLIVIHDLMCSEKYSIRIGLPVDFRERAPGVRIGIDIGAEGLKFEERGDKKGRSSLKVGAPKLARGCHRGATPGIRSGTGAFGAGPDARVCNYLDRTEPN